MIRTIGRLRAGGGTDADALVWAAAVTANSGTYSGTTLTAVSNFTKACKAAGVWTKLNRVNLFAGDQLAAALVPLKVGAGNATDTNTNFVSGDYTEATGLTGNGSTKSLNTGVRQDAFAAGDRHMAVYERVLTGAGRAVMGGDASGAGAWKIQNFAGTYNYLADSNGDTGPGAASAAATAGFHVGVSNTSTSLSMYKNGVSVGTATPPAMVPDPTTQAIFARNRTAGGPGLFSAGTAAGYSMGNTLTAGDAAAYNTIMQVFQTALGRNV